MKYTSPQNTVGSSLTKLFEEILKAESSQDVDFLHKTFQAFHSDSDTEPSFKDYNDLERACLFRYYGYYLSSYGKAKNISSLQERGKNLLTKAINLFSELNETEKSLEAQVILGICYFYEGSISEGEAVFSSISECFEGNHLHPIYLRTQLNTILLLHWKGEFQKALEILEEIEVPMEFCSDARVLIMYHNQAGLIYRGINQLDLAIYHYNKCIEIAQQENNQIVIGKIYNNLAFLCKNSGKYDSAHYHIEKAVTIFRELNHFGWLPHVLDTKAIIYLEERNFSSALETINEVIPIFRKGDDFAGLCDALWNKTRSYLGLNKKLEAVTEFAELYKIAQTHIGEYAAQKYSKLFADSFYAKQHGSLEAEVKRFKEAEISSALRQYKYNFDEAAKLLGIADGNVLKQMILKEFSHFAEELGINRSLKQPEIRQIQSSKESGIPKKINRIELQNVKFVVPNQTGFSSNETQLFYLSAEIVPEAFGLNEDIIVLASEKEKPKIKDFVAAIGKDAGEYIFGQFLHDENLHISYILFEDEPFPTDEIEVIGKCLGYAAFSETDKDTITFNAFPSL